MKSLPIVYKNSKHVWMTSDILVLEFNDEFIPSVKSYLRVRKLEEKVLFLLDNCPAHPPNDLLKSKDEKIAMFLPKNTTAQIQPLEEGITWAFKVYYRQELLGA